MGLHICTSVKPDKSNTCICIPLHVYMKWKRNGSISPKMFPHSIILVIVLQEDVNSFFNDQVFMYWDALGHSGSVDSASDSYSVGPLDRSTC